MKKTRRGFAFGSSQRNRMTLMFGAAPFSATRRKRLTQLRIRVTPRGIRDAPRRLMQHKCF
jgi:hypothetical protein